MRIVTTKEGEKELYKLEAEEFNKEQYKSNNKLSNNINSLNLKNNVANINNSTSKSRKHKINNKINNKYKFNLVKNEKENNNVNTSFIVNSSNLVNNKSIIEEDYPIISKSTVKVRVKKLNINKTEHDKYNDMIYNFNQFNNNNNNNNFSLIASDMPKGISDKNNLSLKIKDILKPQTLNKLKSDFKRQEYIKSNNYKLDENNFRSSYEPSNENKFKSQLSKEIERDKNNLIKYLHSKQQISSKLIEKLANYDKNKITKINRICKIFFHYENNEKLVKDKVKEKLSKYNNEKNKQIQLNIDNIGHLIKNGNKIIDNYKKPNLKNIKAYADIHHFFKINNWSKLRNKHLYEDPKYNLYTDTSVY